MSRTQSHFDTLLERRNLSGGDRLTSLNKSIDSIERKLSEIGKRNAVDNLVAATTAGVKAGVKESAPVSSQPSKIEELEKKIRELSEGLEDRDNQINARQEPQGLDNSGDALAEIAERKRLLNSTAQVPASEHSDTIATQPTASEPGDSEPAVSQDDTVSTEIHGLNSKIENLRHELGGEITSLQKSVSQNIKAGSSSDELERIASGIMELQQAPRFDPNAFDALHEDLNEIRTTIGSSSGQEEINSGFDDISTRLDSFSSKLPGPTGDVLTEITEIKELLNTYAASAGEDKNEELVNQISAIDERLNSLSGASAVESLDLRLQSLIEAVESLASQPQSPQAIEKFEQNLTSIEGRLDEITRAIVAVSVKEQPLQNDDLQAFERLEQHLAELGQGLERISQNADDQQINQLSARIDHMTGQLEVMDASILNIGSNSQFAADAVPEIRAQLETLASRLDMDAAEKQRDTSQLSQMANSIERISQKSDEEQLNALSARIDHMTNQLEVMDASILNIGRSSGSAVDAAPEIKAQLKNLASRLDMDAAEKQRDKSQLSLLTNSIERISQKSDDEQLNALSARIDHMTGQLEVMDASILNIGRSSGPAADNAPEIQAQLETLASRLDTDAADKHRDNNQLTQLVSRIEGLSERIGTFEFTAQAGEDGAVAPGNLISGTSKIEAQLEELANRIDAAVGDVPSSVNLTGIEERLGSIEHNITNKQGATVEAIVQAAQSAVETMDSQGFSGEVINALAEDLRALRVAASQGEIKNTETFISVQDTLNGVAGRLGSIEQQLRTGSGMREQLDVSPSIDPSSNLQPGRARQPEDNRPLEPGSGAPPISAAVRAGRNDGDESKIDFVAAARRAAQSAAAHAQIVNDEQPVEKKSATNILSRLQNIPRKPIIVAAAAAVLLAVMVFAGSKLIFGGPGDTAIVALNQQAAKATATLSKGKITTTPTSRKFATIQDAGKTSAKKIRPVVSNVSPGNELVTGKKSVDVIAQITPQLSSPQSSGMLANVPAKQTGSFVAPSMTGENGLSAPAANASSENVTAAVDKIVDATITQAPLPSARLGPITLRKAAAKGDVRAQHEIAQRYSNDKIVKRDLVKAAKWYQRAAAQEFAPAQYRLGSLYEKGLGVKRDMNTATNWYRRAAQQGNARAMHNLAVISAMGSVGEPDLNEALKWFVMAADLGVKDSQFNLGILYGQGMGVKQDLAQSFKWFALAAKTGDADSAKKRDEVANVMDPKSLEKTRLLVSAWRPGKLIQEANRVVVPEEWRGNNSAISAALTGRAGVKQTQMLLNKLGYKVGTPDGVAGPRTRNAILNFQRKTGIAPTGAISAELIKTLQGLSI